MGAIDEEMDFQIAQSEFELGISQGGDERPPAKRKRGGKGASLLRSLIDETVAAQRKLDSQKKDKNGAALSKQAIRRELVLSKDLCDWNACHPGRPKCCKRQGCSLAYGVPEIHALRAHTSNLSPAT